MALLLAGATLAGCAADGGNMFTTGAIGTSQQTAAAEPQVDPTCVTLAARIDGLRKEGIADKIEKAAVKKYKMTQADLGKADQLTKANGEFQVRCSTITPRPSSAQVHGGSVPAGSVASPAPGSSATPGAVTSVAPRNTAVASEGSLN
jgi:hypothetical protein